MCSFVSEGRDLSVPYILLNGGDLNAWTRIV